MANHREPSIERSGEEFRMEHDDIEIKEMQLGKGAPAGNAEGLAAEGEAFRRFSRKSQSPGGPRLSRAQSQDGWYNTAPISDGFYDRGMPRASLQRTSSFARSVSSQATYRDPFNGSMTTAPRSYLRSTSSPLPPPLPSSVASWRSALEEAISNARAPLASLPQTLAHNHSKENERRHVGHGAGSDGPCFHCEEAVQARAAHEKLEAAKQVCEAAARTARAEATAGAAREAVLEAELEAMQKRVRDAAARAARAEEALHAEHAATLEAAAEWRKKSLDEARKHAGELTSLSDAMKDQWQQGNAAAERARRDAENAAAAERDELRARLGELERAKENAEAAARASETQAQVSAARLLKLDDAVEKKTKELRRKADELHDRNRLLQGDAEALSTALDVAKQTETALRGQMDEAGAAAQADVETAREEAHRWRHQCREAQETARGLIAEQEELRRRKEEQAARPFDEVREELDGAMARALERHGIHEASEGLSDDAYLAAMARLQAQRAQTEKQRLAALARGGADVAALQRAASDWAARQLAAAATGGGRARAHSMPTRWEERRERLQAVPRALKTTRRPTDGRSPGEETQGSVTVDSTPEHTTTGQRGQPATEGLGASANESPYGGDGTQSRGGSYAASPAAGIGRGGRAGSGLGPGSVAASSARSTPSRNGSEMSELADSDWGAVRSRRTKT